MAEEIGWWHRLARKANDTLTFGWAADLRRVKEEIGVQAKLYAQVLAQIASEEANIKGQLAKIGRTFQSAMQSLARAERLLKPTEESDESHSRMLSLAIPSSAALKITRMNADYDDFMRVAAGAGAGAAAAAGVWGAVQLVGHASTGAAMIALHGAAASSAGWAWLGGGSLTAGGGGMALGHFVLPGVGSIVAVAVGAFLTHKELDRRKLELDELWNANRTNRNALAQLNRVTANYDAGINRIQGSAQRLEAAVIQAELEVMKFGLFSRIWKMLRRLCGFGYYNSRERFELRQLEDAIASFFASLRDKCGAGAR